MPYSFIVEVTE